MKWHTNCAFRILLGDCQREEYGNKITKNIYTWASLWLGKQLLENTGLQAIAFVVQLVSYPLND